MVSKANVDRELAERKVRQTHYDTEEIRSPIVDDLRDIMQKGHEQGTFRLDVDPMQLYISIISLCYFYVSNMQTLSIVFDRDLSQFAPIQDREAEAVNMVLSYLEKR